MAGFHEVQFPPAISYGSSGGPGFNTNIIEMDSGVDERVARWSHPRHSYDVSKGFEELADLYEVKSFYINRQGPANGFRYKDWQDYTSNPTNGYEALGVQDQLIDQGDGVTVAFQLIKWYNSGANSYARPITKPVHTNEDGVVIKVSIWVNSVLKTEGVDYTVNYTTGVVMFGAAPANGHDIHASFQFDVPVAFAREMDKVLAASIDAFESGSMPSIILEEIVNPDPPYTGEYFYGRSDERAINASFTIDTTARVWAIHANSAGLSVRLPDPAAMPTGGIHFVITNDATGNTFTVKDHLGVTLSTLTVGQGCIVVLTVDSVGTKVWYSLG